MVQFIDTESILLDEETLDELPRAPNCLLLHSPEITLKGRNQRDFKAKLARNIRRRLRALGADWQVRPAHGRVYIDVSDSNASVESALEALEQVPGVEDVAAVYWLPPGLTGQRHGLPDWPIVEDAAVRVAEAAYRPDAAFAVRVHRADKRLLLKSPEIGRRLGDAIVERTPWDRVDLSNPDCTIKLDIYKDGMYVYAGRRKSIGGLPVGSGGRVLGLLSDGIDSPVASFLLAKRGCLVDHVHMTANCGTVVDHAASIVAQLARRLSLYALDTRLFLLPGAQIDAALAGQDTGFELVMFRRFLMRAAQAVAARIGAAALVTGDSLGQMSTQTLENLVSSLSAVDIPVFQPLIGQNKQEIMAVARRIGTYEASVESHKDSRARLSRNPRTRSRPAELARLEAELMPNYDTMIQATLSDAVCLQFACGELVETRTGEAALGNL